MRVHEYELGHLALPPYDQGNYTSPLRGNFSSFGATPWGAGGSFTSPPGSLQSPSGGSCSPPLRSLGLSDRSRGVAGIERLHKRADSRTLRVLVWRDLRKSVFPQSNVGNLAVGSKPGVDIQVAEEPGMSRVSIANLRLAL